MYMFLVVISSIISIVLMIVVLMQASKGDGLSGTFGGAAGSMGTMFGARRTADFLSKSTWWLAGSLAVLAIAINLLFLPGKINATQRESIIQQSGKQQIPQTPTLPQTQSIPPAQSNNQPKK